MRAVATKSALEQRGISFLVCFSMLASGQTHSRLEPNGDRYNGGSDHQEMVLPCRREKFHLLMAGKKYHPETLLSLPAPTSPLHNHGLNCDPHDMCRAHVLQPDP